MDQKLVEEYLKNGGKIKQIPEGEKTIEKNKTHFYRNKRNMNKPKEKKEKD